MDSHAQPPHEILFATFRSTIFERPFCKNLIEQFVIESLNCAKKLDEDPNLDKNEVEQIKADEILVHQIIKGLATMRVNAEDFEDPFLSMTKQMFARYKKEIQDQLAQEQMGSMGSGTHGSRSTGVGYTPKPMNNYPYKCTSGHVGLRNQGATCYLNSVIQSLFMTKPFRRLLFKWRYDPKKNRAPEKCIPLQLQKLLARLKLSDQQAVETTDLTASFGWTKADSFVQHDAQELLRVLFEALEPCMPTNQLFQGVNRDTVVCRECHTIGGNKD